MTVEIARITGTQPLDSLAAQPEGLAGLSTLGHFHLGTPSQRGHFDLTPQRSGGELDRNFTVQIIAIALEHAVRLDLDFNEQVTRRTTIDPGLTVAARADPHALINSSRDFHFERLILARSAHPFASGAGIGNDPTRTMAMRTGLLNREESLLDAHRPPTTARAARLRLGSGFGAAALAGLTALPTRHTNLRLVAIGSLLERDLHRVAQIRPAVHVGSTTPAPAGPRLAEDIAKNIAKDIGEAARARTTSPCAHVGVNAGMPVTVVGGPLLLIGEHFVGFFRLLELGLGVFTVRISVRVVFHRQLAIRLLELLFGGVFREAEHLVEIPFRHRCLFTSIERSSGSLRLNAGTEKRAHTAPGRSNGRDQRPLSWV